MREERRRKQGGGHKREISEILRRGASHGLGITLQHHIHIIYMDTHTRTHTHIDFTDVLVDWLWSRPQHKHYAEE